MDSSHASLNVLRHAQALWQQALPSTTTTPAPRRAKAPRSLEQDTLLLAAVMANAIEDARQALNDGANPNAFQKPGRESVLMNAVTSNAPGMVRLLLDAGADVSGRNTKGYVALHRCVAHDSVIIADMLLSAGAAIDAATAGGFQLLDLALNAPQNKACRRLIMWAIEKGAEPTHRPSRDNRRENLNETLVRIAIEQASLPMMLFVNRRRYALDPDASPDQVVKTVGLPTVDEAWVKAIARDALDSLHMLVKAGWIPGLRSMVDQREKDHQKHRHAVPKEGVFWGWIAQRHHASRCFAWIMTIAEAPALLAGDAQAFPDHTYLKIEKPTVDQVTTLVASHVDLDGPSGGGAPWMRHLVDRTDLTRSMMTWVATHRPDWMTTPGPAGFTALSQLGEQGPAAHTLRTEWNLRLARREAQVLRATISTVRDDPALGKMPRRPRSRL